MKKQYLFLLPLIVCSLAGCGSNGMSDQEIFDTMISDSTLLLDPSGGLFEPGTTKQLEGGDSLNAVKKYTYTVPGRKGKNATVQPEISWSFSDSHWSKSAYSKDTSRVLLVPDSVYASEDEYSSDITLTMKWKKFEGKLTYHTYMNKTTLTGTTYKLADYRAGLAAGTIQESDNIITYGYISGAHGEDHEYSGVYIADGKAGLMLYANKLSNCWTTYNLKVGDLVQVAGFASPYNGLMEVKPTLVRRVTAAEVLVDNKPYTVSQPDYTEIAAGTFNETTLKTLDGALVKMNNLTFVTIGGSNTTIPSTHTNEYTTLSSHTYVWFKDSTGASVGMSISYHLGELSALQAMFATWTCDSTKVNFTGHLTWYNAPYLAPVKGTACFSLAD